MGPSREEYWSGLPLPSLSSRQLSLNQLRLLQRVQSLRTPPLASRAPSHWALIGFLEKGAPPLGREAPCPCANFTRCDARSAREAAFLRYALGAEFSRGATRGGNEVADLKWRLGKEAAPGYPEGRTTGFCTK